MAMTNIDLGVELADYDDGGENNRDDAITCVPEGDPTATPLYLGSVVRNIPIIIKGGKPGSDYSVRVNDTDENDDGTTYSLKDLNDMLQQKWDDHDPL
jgi:hypothetical protein